MLLESGQQIDRYVVEGVLGEGAMAAVYRVRHRSLGSVMALKVLQVSTAKVRKRLLQEARVQARIDHANVARVHDVMDLTDTTAVLMEYIRGPSLQAFLEVHRPSLEESLAILGGVLAGVEAAHRAGLVHRDLKPENILLSVGDDGVWPKIIDFGIVKADSAKTWATRPGATMGTPAYMAPEQIEDASSVTEQADVWSLGCILYEMVCGRRAFEGDSALGVMNNVADGEFVPIHVRAPELPEHVARAITEALTVDLADRTPDVRTFAARLAGVETVSSAGAVLGVCLSLESQAAAAVFGLMPETVEPVPHRELQPPTVVSNSLSPDGTLATPRPPTTSAPSGSQRWILAIAGLAALAVAVMGLAAAGVSGLGIGVFVSGTSPLSPDTPPEVRYPRDQWASVQGPSGLTYWLERADGSRYEAGREVPPATYTVWLGSVDGSVVDAGELTVVPRDAVTLICRGAPLECVAEARP